MDIFNSDFFIIAFILIKFTVVTVFITYSAIKIDRSRPCSRCDLGRIIKRRMKRKRKRKRRHRAREAPAAKGAKRRKNSLS